MCASNVSGIISYRGIFKKENYDLDPRTSDQTDWTDLNNIKETVKV